MIDINCSINKDGIIESTILKGGSYDVSVNKDLEVNVIGIGVPSGGTKGQLLMKTDDTDFKTEWTSIIDGGTF